MIDHVKSTSKNKLTDIFKFCLLDKYDDYGNYIGDNPKYMDTEEEESESDE